MKLTKRELEVVRCLADGLSNKEIADVLSISAHCVKFHIANATRHLKARNRTHAAVIYVRNAVEIDLASTPIEA